MHIFGHIHESRGLTRTDLNETTFINAASCTRFYASKNEPFVFELPLPFIEKDFPTEMMN